MVSSSRVRFPFAADQTKKVTLIVMLWLVVDRIDGFALVRANDVHFGLYFSHQLSFFLLLLLVLFGLREKKNALAAVVDPVQVLRCCRLFTEERKSTCIS